MGFQIAGRQDLRCVQKSPVQPGVQWQAPSSALQLPPLWQLHVWKQAGPQNPGGQAGDGWDAEGEGEAEQDRWRGGGVHVRAEMPAYTQAAFPGFQCLTHCQDYSNRLLAQ